MSENEESEWRAVGGAEAAHEEKAAAPTEEAYESTNIRSSDVSKYRISKKRS